MELLERCADTLLEQAERKGPTGAPKSHPGETPVATDPTHRRVPLELRRIVRQRDGGQCSFVSPTGRRCEARKRLDCDHILPIAKGGKTTVDNLRLLCRAHNQHMADRELGAEFMRRKRGTAKSRRDFARAHEGSRVSTKADHDAPSSPLDERTRRRAEVIPFLIGLGYSHEHARRGAALCDGMLEATLHERVQFALAQLGPDPDRVLSHARKEAG